MAVGSNQERQISCTNVTDYQALTTSPVLLPNDLYRYPCRNILMPAFLVSESLLAARVSWNASLTLCSYSSPRLSAGTRDALPRPFA